MLGLEQRIREARAAIERWFGLAWMAQPPPFYASVDVRNAGFKLAPVDTNLFPGGWNNLTPQMLPLAADGARAAIEEHCPGARKLLIVPESHTRNYFYLANVLQLQHILRRAGLEVRIGSVSPAIRERTALALPGGEHLVLEPVVRGRNRIGLADFDPCAVLLNNDLSAGVPGLLDGLHEQPMLPPLHAGWHVRRKSGHFERYDVVARRFAGMLGVDPWLISPLYSRCGDIRFADGTGLESLRSHVDALLTRIRLKYQEHGVQETPFVVVKADNGTYGMGILTVRDVADLEQLSRRTRNKMNVIKDGQVVSDVIVQEGVSTRERVGDATAEPVVYLMDRQVVGGFYRVHAERGVDENLNAPGARFEPLAMPSAGDLPDHFYANGVIGRLAALAASHELQDPLESPDPELHGHCRPSVVPRVASAASLSLCAS